MGLYKNILVTLDCSNVDNIIIEHVSKLASTLGSKVYLFHVVHSHTLDEDSYLLEKTRKGMAVHEAFLRKFGIEVFQIIKSGEPDKMVLEEIETGNYDLLAMATHGHKAIMDFILGSVSKSVKHKTTIPVLMIKGR